MSRLVFPILWAIGMLVFAGVIAMRARLALPAGLARVTRYAGADS